MSPDHREGFLHQQTAVQPQTPLGMTGEVSQVHPVGQPILGHARNFFPILYYQAASRLCRRYQMCSSLDISACLSKGHKQVAHQSGWQSGLQIRPGRFDSSVIFLLDLLCCVCSMKQVMKGGLLYDPKSLQLLSSLQSTTSQSVWGPCPSFAAASR